MPGGTPPLEPVTPSATKRKLSQQVRIAQRRRVHHSADTTQRGRLPALDSAGQYRRRSKSPARHGYFCELFAGAAGLSAAVRRVGKVARPLSSLTPDYQHRTGFNLLNLSDFQKLLKEIKQGRIRWLHAAPPCKTFSRARRNDCFAKARTLRTPAEPAGVRILGRIPMHVQEANVLATRTAKLCKAQMRANGFFSVENPECSFVWDLPCFKQIASCRGCRLYCGDQCCFGGLYKKASAWLSNAPWLKLLELRCPGPPVHPRHAPLKGFVTNPDGSRSWLTEWAAEYPEGLCNEVAKAFASCQSKPEVLPDISISAAGTADPLENLPRRMLREAENQAALGGMRNPSTSVARIPGWGSVGDRLRYCLERIVTEHEDTFRTIIGALGTATASAIPERIVQSAQLAIEAEFGIPAGRTGHHSSMRFLRGDILQALVTAARDPERSVPDWVDHGAPLGIVHDIPTHGIFPPVQEGGASDLSSLDEAEAFHDFSSFANYASFAENFMDAEQEIKRELMEQFLRWSPDLTMLEAEVGKLIPSKMAAVITEKNGRRKTRLIHDLRQSLVNSWIRCPERIILPRLSDAIWGACKVISAMLPGEQVRQLVLDFKDAFKMLPVRADEMRFLAGAATVDGVDGHFYYTRVLFGVLTGPLLWGRVAALVMRCSASLYPADILSLQCYVDDPHVVVRGKEAERLLRLSTLLLLWSALNLQLAWPKGLVGPDVTWIGASLRWYPSCDQPEGVEVSLAQEKCSKVGTDAAALAACALVQRKTLREFAGFTSWIAVVLPCVRPFAQMIWAAACAQPRGAETKHHVASKRVALPLQWFQALATESFVSLVRRCPARVPDRGPMVTFDASLTGGGATLHSSGDAAAAPDAWLALAWTQSDRRALCAEEGDPAFQAHWEAYALLIAVWSWRHLLKAEAGPLTVRGDAKGVLQSVVARRSKNPTINLIVAELQLALSHTDYDIFATHFWSERNVVCDRLI